MPLKEDWSEEQELTKGKIHTLLLHCVPLEPVIMSICGEDRWEAGKPPLCKLRTRTLEALTRRSEKSYVIERAPWKLNVSTIDSQQTNLIKLVIKWHKTAWNKTNKRRKTTETFRGLPYSNTACNMWLNKYLLNTLIWKIQQFTPVIADFESKLSKLP